MAACESLQRIFEKPLPNPTMMESLSPWHQIISMKPIEHSSCTEIFGELHFKENLQSSSSSPSSPLAILSSPSSSSSIFFNTAKDNSLNNNEGNKKSPSSDYFSTNHRKQYLGSHRNSDSFSSVNSDSFLLCTEGLGFESSDDVEDLISDIDINNHWKNQERATIKKHTRSLSESLCCEFRRPRTNSGAFPPPISSIGKSGKPCVCFKSYRRDGRFVLKEIRIPTQEFLHAYREDGRLKLHLVQSDDEILEEEDEEEEEEEDDDDDDEDKENEEKHGDDNHESNNNGGGEENDDEKNVEINKNEVGGDPEKQTYSSFCTTLFDLKANQVDPDLPVFSHPTETTFQ
ncbi:hypothetical protein F0562_022269 [Nyssa sinensis]|uniref:FAF domain-containing protein n=1 Tax=Nyssa sinensis TaxID=561372 RepID=A0A5J5BR72_9ASTE|nr:hypothetical protein F0562_022269 [Nyssa sinensis]